MTTVGSPENHFLAVLLFKDNNAIRNIMKLKTIKEDNYITKF